MGLQEAMQGASVSSKRPTMLHRAVSAGIPGFFRVARRELEWQLWSTIEVRFYRQPVRMVEGAEPGFVRKDSPEDLLCYTPCENWQPSKAEFLHSALARIERGSHVFTRVEDGVLVHFGWSTERAKDAYITEVQHSYTYPDDSAVLWDFYSHPDYRGRGFFSKSLRCILNDLTVSSGTKWAYIFVLADNVPSRSVIEKAGFEYQQSMVRRARCFRHSVRVATVGSVGG